MYSRPVKLLRVRLDDELGAALDRLKTERHVNLSAWVRSLLRSALVVQLQNTPGSVGTLPEPTAPAADPPSAPLPGWSPWKLDDDSWGSRYQGDTRALPEDLVGCAIEVTTRRGESWVTRIVEVLEWTPDFVLVRDSGKPDSA